MEEKKNKTKRRLWRGLTTTTASLLALSLSASMVIDTFRTDIDKFLGTQSSQMITESQSEGDYVFQSDYSSTTELLDAIEDLGERMNEEGSVLLKNENHALPLTEEETQKVSLLGFSSYYPVQGGDFGSTLSVNTGTDADTVDFVQALAAKGYSINPTVQNLYENLKGEYESLLTSLWGTSENVNRITAPAIDGTFSSRELSTDTMDSTDSTWRDSMNDYNVMIVTLARAAGENKNYMPGEAGVDPEQNLNQSDPLGLSDTERQIINAAVDAKAENGGKVIVLLNNASAMEIEEIKDNTGVDAILEIGLPGGYGFYGVADVLSGAANPSGHLSDTYAVDNSASPAAQNYGNYSWTNPDSAYSINSEVVYAESIYAGYKYYETRYADVVMGQGNADDAVGSSTGGAWSYDEEVSYPFGYGLSYTTFSQTLDSLEVNLEDRTVTAQVTVTNTGDVAGKDVVQLYVSVPYTDYDRANLVEKSEVQLLDYGKTEELQPGESVTLTLTADAQDMASWDSTCANEAGTTGNYILDAGDYYFTIGNGSHEAVNNVLAAKGYTEADGMTDAGNSANVQTWTLNAMDTASFAYTVNGTAVENQLADMDLNYYMPGTVTYLTRADWSGTWPKTYENLTATDEMLDIMDNDTYEITAQGDTDAITWGADNGLTVSELKGADYDDEQWDELMDQLNLEDAMIRTGFGGTSTKAIESISSPEVIQNDGPNGINSYTLG